MREGMRENERKVEGNEERAKWSLGSTLKSGSETVTVPGGGKVKGTLKVKGSEGDARLGIVTHMDQRRSRTHRICRRRGRSGIKGRRPLPPFSQISPSRAFYFSIATAAATTGRRGHQILGGREGGGEGEDQRESLSLSAFLSF